MDLSTALTRFFNAFEAVDELVKACSELGIELVRPRKMLIYRKRLEGFLGQAELGALPPGAIIDLYQAVEAIDNPETVLEQLTMAGVRGKALAKFRAWQAAYEHLVTASANALQGLEE